ncbi:enamine deaminase RidA [Microvirga sp. KLBC 81]|uniref:RidA family protein n=1 Tax=Microvirga sp. KLBC 81 TaxID=1862707 RepID=UPI000D5146C5|nr:RidA family protein [Microvirga sp. KLBC 81]PVE24166.1 enamine deaminase RidA [Microvirga sp. KLBC 81]
MTVSGGSQATPILDEGVAALQPKNWPTPKGYSNGMMAEGRILVTGGIVGWNEAGEFPEGFVAQARQVLENICTILAEGGAKPRHVVRLTWYVVDIDDYLANLRELGRAYRSVFGTHYPAMALVQVVRLVERNALVEIEATAVVPSGK